MLPLLAMSYPYGEQTVSRRPGFGGSLSSVPCSEPTELGLERDSLGRRKECSVDCSSAPSEVISVISTISEKTLRRKQYAERQDEAVIVCCRQKINPVSSAVATGSISLANGPLSPLKISQSGTGVRAG